MTERNDTSKISPTNPEYDVANVDDRILNYTKQIRKNMFTDNITEAMARVAELAGLIAGESSDTAKYVKDFYDEVLLAWESDPNKDPELIAARGGQPQLKDRLENTDRQLDQKANKDEVVKKGYGTLSDFDEPTRAQIQGLESGQINAVLGKKNVKNENLDDKVVSPRNTTFAKHGKNLSDEIYERGSFTGAIPFTFNETSNGKVEIVRIKPSKTYTVSKSNDTDRFRIATSDVYPTHDSVLASDGHKITDSINPKTFTASETDNYLIIYVSSDGAEPAWLQVEEGRVATPYSNKVIIDLEDESVKKGALEVSVQRNLDSVEDMLIFKNLFDGQYKTGFALTQHTGEGVYKYATSNGGIVVVFRGIPGETYTISKSNDSDRFRVATFTSEPTVDSLSNRTISEDATLRSVTVTLTSEENYIVIFVSTSEQSKQPSELQIEYGFEATEYSPPNTKVIKSEYIPSTATVGRKRFVITHNPNGNYITNTPTQDYNLTVGEEVLTELYEMWDDFIGKIPDYTITKKVEGTGSGGYPIYSYKFTPHTPQINALNKKFPKILYLGGIHGHERFCNYEDVRFFKDLVNNHNTNDVLKMLRYNVEFCVIPVVCPWGFVNKSRVNANGVNIGRNFDADWNYIPPSDTLNYSGEAPNDQPETQVIDQLLAKHKDAIFMMDRHNFNELTSDGYIGWLSSRSQKVHDVLFGVANYMDGYTRTEVPSLLVDEPLNLTRNLYALRTPIGGGLATYAHVKYGIPAMLCETIFTWGSDVYSASYDSCQKILVEMIGNIIQAVVTNNEHLIN